MSPNSQPQAHGLIREAGPRGWRTTSQPGSVVAPWSPELASPACSAAEAGSSCPPAWCGRSGRGRPRPPPNKPSPALPTCLPAAGSGSKQGRPQEPRRNGRGGGCDETLKEPSGVSTATNRRSCTFCMIASTLGSCARWPPSTAAERARPKVTASGLCRRLKTVTTRTSSICSSTAKVLSKLFVLLQICR